MRKPSRVPLTIGLWLAVAFATGLLPASQQPAGTVERPPYQPAPPYQAFLAALEKAGNPLDRMTAESVPQLWTASEVRARNVLAPIAVGSVRDRCVPARNHQIPVRIYTPSDRKLARGGKLPVVVFYHGGGWTLGSIAQYDSLTRALANKIPAMVVSVDYRLSPEHPFPAAVEDAYLALEWVARNAGDIGASKDRIAVAGDSGGGNLATVTARKARLAGIDVVYEALFYPSTDIGRTDYPSYEQYGRGYYLTGKAVRTFRGFYLPSARDRASPDASPLRAPADQLARLPPTLIVVAGCDPLRDEGLAYAKKLRDNKVPVTCWTKKEMIHGFLNFFNNGTTGPAASRLAEPVLDDAAAEVRKAFIAAGH